MKRVFGIALLLTHCLVPRAPSVAAGFAGAAWLACHESRDPCSNATEKLESASALYSSLARAGSLAARLPAEISAPGSEAGGRFLHQNQ